MVVLFGTLTAPKANAATVGLPFGSANLTDTTTVRKGDGLSTVFGASNPWPNIRWNAPEGSSWDWSGTPTMLLAITNPGREDVEFYVRVDDDASADGMKHCVTASAKVSAGKSQQFALALSSANGPDAMGMRFGPTSPVGELGTMMLAQGSLDPHHIVAYQIFRARPKESATLIFQPIALTDKTASPRYDKLVDRYGQYSRANWPGKVHDDKDFSAQAALEQADLKAHPAPANRDKWGGWLDGPQLKATGFFRTEKRDEKWWLVDPEGRLFLSVGVDCIRPNESTVVQGRESMFAELPAAGDPLAGFYGSSTWQALPGSQYSGKTFNLYGANLQRKYGTAWEAAFCDNAASRLRSWGFNTFGNWSNESAPRERHFPYVATAGAWGNFARVPSGVDYWGKMPDPFDPEFAAAVDRSIKQKARDVKDDAACVGYFVDNELSWGGGETDALHYGLSYGTLSLDAKSPAKAAFVELLKSRYTTIGKLNAAWGVSLASWDELMAPYKASSPLATEVQRKDFSDFLGVFSSKYFEVVSSTIKRYDPNHLYLGCRFAWYAPEEVAASAKYVDVISFNIYHWDRNQYLFAEKLGKPIIIGEFHFGALDRGMFSGGLVPVKDQMARGERYAAYIRDVLSEPAFVGAHWFQYADEPTTGRYGDGENYNIGFVSITDTPYPEIVAAARAVNAKVYDIHGAAK
jgi:hypothetical protein